MQTVVRFRCIIQLIRDDPQMLSLLIKLFEFKSCDFTVQVNFFTFVNDFIYISNHKNHS